MSSKSYSEEDEYSTDYGEVEYSREGYSDEENESEEEENEDESGGGGKNADEVENEGGEEENEDDESGDGGEDLTEDEEEENEDENGEGEEEENEDESEEVENGGDEKDESEDDSSGGDDDPMKWKPWLQQKKYYGNAKKYLVQFDAGIENCDDLTLDSDWDWHNPNSFLDISWKCLACGFENRNSVHYDGKVTCLDKAYRGFIPRPPGDGLVHLNERCTECNQRFWAQMDISRLQPLDIKYHTGIMMSLNVFGAEPTSYHNPPEMMVTSVLNGVSFTHRHITPDPTAEWKHVVEGLPENEWPVVCDIVFEFWDVGTIPRT
ncbi:uncharacterized protein LOC142164395 [Nicotiana tabacum]|uniref:Uncharacterized protein LOC142164395 n=1 Tax=Nicotiana tabacum TaxID=4097 RepID=A0AC58S0T9_TOBAC